MFWNLIVKKYEQYHLTHVMMLVLLGLYSLFGALCFCALEAENERENLHTALEISKRKSSLARDRLLYDLQFYFIRQINVSRLLSKEFHTTLDYYDKLMGFELIKDNAGIKKRARWNIWGGLYFAGSVYTTIGYGDIVTETIAGKIFTVFYAIVGIPLLITVLNIWGNGLFQLMQILWQNYIIRIKRNVKFPAIKRKRLRERKRLQEEEDIEDEDYEEFIVNGKKYNNNITTNDGYTLVTVDDKLSSETTKAQLSESSKLPIRLAIMLLISWVFICAAVFCFFEKWAFFDAAYFFFISLTTIGLGDSIANHEIMCMYFLLILIGLAVVSMAISVIQLKIEILFSTISKSIDNDFKNLLTAEKRKFSMGTNVGDERKISENIIAVSVPRPSLAGTSAPMSGDDLEAFTKEHNALEKYGTNLSFADRILMRMMSSHQQKMLNQKLRERQKMRSIGSQTQNVRTSAFAQTEQELPANAAALQSAYYSSSESSSEEESTPAPNSFAALMAAAAVAGRRSASTGPAAAQRLNAAQGHSAPRAIRRGVSATTTVSAGAVSTSAPTRPHRLRGLTRKKLYIYNTGD